MQERRAKTGGLCLFVFVSVNLSPHLNTKAEAAGAFHQFKGMSLIQEVERRKKQHDFIVKETKKVVTKLELSFSCLGCRMERQQLSQQLYDVLVLEGRCFQNLKKCRLGLRGTHRPSPTLRPMPDFALW